MRFIVVEPGLLLLRADLRIDRGDRGHVDHAARGRGGVRMCAGLEMPIRIGPMATPSVITRTML